MFNVVPEAKLLIHNRFQKAADRTLDDLREGGVQQEPQITDRLMARMNDAIDDLDVEGVRFRSITFSDRGRNSEESPIGADFAGFLTLAYPDKKVVKVFLAQAKMSVDNEKIGFLRSGERSRLLTQIDNMLAITPESYITVYTKRSIKFLPAISI